MLEVNATLSTSTLLATIKSSISQPPPDTVTLSCSNATAGATVKTCFASFESADDAATIKRMVEEDKVAGVMAASYDGTSPTSEEDDDSTIIIIVVCVVLGGLLLIGGGVGIAYWLKTKRSNNVDIDQTEMVLNDPDDHLL